MAHVRRMPNHETLKESVEAGSGEPAHHGPDPESPLSSAMAYCPSLFSSPKTTPPRESLAGRVK